jgi:heat shock protein HslJ
MIYHYCYRITNKANHKHYYGSRSCIEPPKLDLGIRYFSSSKYVLADMNQYGREAFRYKILKSFLSRRDAFAFERKCQLRTRAVERDDFYNRAYTPAGGKFVFSGPMTENGKHILSEKAKARYAERPMTEQHKKHLSHLLSERMQSMTDEQRSEKFGNFGKDNSFYGKTHSEEVRQLLSQKSKMYMSEHGNPFDGKRHTDKTKEYLSDQMKLRWKERPETFNSVRKPREKFPCERCQTIVSQGMYNRWHATGKCDPDTRRKYCETRPSHNKGHSVVARTAAAIQVTEDGVRVLCGMCNQWFAESTFKRYHTTHKGEHHGKA